MEKALNPLYEAWLDGVRALFGLLLPGGLGAEQLRQYEGVAGEPPETAAARAGVEDFAASALGAMTGAMAQLQAFYGPLLAQPEALVSALRSTADAQRRLLAQWREGFAESSPQAMPAPPAPWGLASEPSAPLFMAAGAGTGAATHVLQSGIDRSLGALADAFGLRSTREMQETWVQLVRAEARRRVALADYLAVMSDAFGDGVGRLLATLREMHDRSESVGSMTDLTRLWLRSLDAAVHEAMRSQTGLAATAQLVRTSSIQRESLQRLVALASRALNVPTRAEVDAAYREIQALKRDVRALKKARPPGALAVSTSSPAPAAPRAARAARGRAAAGSSGSGIAEAAAKGTGA